MHFVTVVEWKCYSGSAPRHGTAAASRTPPPTLTQQRTREAEIEAGKCGNTVAAKGGYHMCLLQIFAPPVPIGK